MCHSRRDRTVFAATVTQWDALKDVSYTSVCTLYIYFSSHGYDYMYLGWSTWELSGILQRQPGPKSSMVRQRLDAANWKTICLGFTSSRPPSRFSSSITFYTPSNKTIRYYQLIIYTSSSSVITLRINHTSQFTAGVSFLWLKVFCYYYTTIHCVSKN